MAVNHPVKPVDAAGLVLIRAAARGEPEILLGRRHAKAGFLPDVFVVPGGRVERADRLASGAREALAPHVRGSLRIGAATTDPLVFARCALRETYEETGLLIGRPQSGSDSPPLGPCWEPYRRQRIRPAFEAMEFVMRAITPPYMPRRFNTRFFLVDGGLALGAMAGDGELEDLAWRPPAAISSLPLVDVTQALLRQALECWKRNDGMARTQPNLLIYKNNNAILRPLGASRL